jgi:FAD/FMN-containing dehydrogenase
MPPAATDEDLFFENQAAIYECVHDQVTRFSGSISAEHGIGQLKARRKRARHKSRR